MSLMILKEIDSKNHKNQMRTLDALLKNSTSDKQKSVIRIERAKLENGYKAEKENAYYINFNLSDSKNTIILHDIRLEHNGRTAQFDHILVDRVEIVILESKSFKNSILTIKKDGSLEVQNGKKIYTQSNPVEQNNRHKVVLESFLKDNFNFSNRLIVNHKVLIHPETNIANKILPEGFVRADAFVSQWLNEKESDTNGFLKVVKIVTTRLISEKNTHAIANLLMNSHRPILFDYTKKYRVPSKPKLENKIEENQGIYNIEKDCPRCKEGKLVLRKSKGKSNKYASNKFFGCDRFPKCRFTKSTVC
ncbi:MAG: hypothetical protein Ctma_0916 [Catillopecten margaritatus gill symbiont]|uniref:NERD domain-containing protein n=1 Tax=Catillopecten margaritatus gill symbiont TaxID=3083288 RepID=A0AAU6PGR6_9GAMM